MTAVTPQGMPIKKPSKTDFFGAKFERSKISTLDGRPEVRYVEKSGTGNPFAIVCSTVGVRFQGRLEKQIETELDLQDFAELMSMAWKDHKAIIPKIETEFERDIL